MVCKRAFDDEESYEIAPKHRRQYEDHTTQSSPILETDPCDDGSQRLSSDGEGENSYTESQDEGRVSKTIVNESLNGANSGSHYGPFDNISSYWWLDSNLSDDFSDLNSGVHLSYFPNYFELDHRVKTSVQPDEIYTTFLDQSPRKLVSVGPEYQADIPEWAPQDSKNSVRGNVIGTCVMPMPDLQSSVFNCNLGDRADRDCKCDDRGSIGCVRQHVIEARDELREKIGQKIYEELGFCDMGEEVARKWSEEEEQAFHEAVFSNRASLGKNFWDHLPYVLPSRTKKDLVSYYFNVFMLQIRAEQNRFDPLNIDSDNDEWQGSELGIMEEVSVIESLANQENFVEASENEDDSNCTNFHEVSGKMYDSCIEDKDTQDYSCTSNWNHSDPVNLGIDGVNQVKSDCG